MSTWKYGQAHQAQVRTVQNVSNKHLSQLVPDTLVLNMKSINFLQN